MNCFSLLNKAYANDTSGAIVQGEPENESPIICNTFKLTESSHLNFYFGFQRINETFLKPDTVYHALNFRNFPFVRLFNFKYSN